MKAVLLFIGLVAAVYVQPHFQEAHPCVMAKSCSASDFELQGDAPLEHVHQVTFAIKRKNIEYLQSRLAQLSDPDHRDYQKWFTTAQVHNLTNWPEATTAVKGWLKRAGFKVSQTKTGAYVTAFGVIRQFSNLFATKFFKFTSPAKGVTINRALYTNIPNQYSQYIDFVSGVVNFPQVLKPTMKIESLLATGSTTPALLSSFYKINQPAGGINPQATQSLFESLGQSFSPSDLTAFQNKFGLPVQAVAKVIGPNTPSNCQSNPNNCAEASLDVQYIMAVAQKAPTTFWSIAGNGDIFLEWAMAISASANPPLVNSISYGSIEKEEDPASLRRFCNDMMTLGTQGVTVMVATGDDGVANFPARGNPGACGFSPSFPATCPFVTAVGATQGPEDGKPEIACSSKTGGLITSGGGFSTVFQQPSYQAAAVNNYLSTGPALPPTSMFASTGRGYPDIAMLGHNYEVAIGGRFYQVSGTSCSTPVAAGVMTLINSARFAAGKQGLGFVNPTIYKGATSTTVNPLFNDITSGKNNCAAGSPQFANCCQYGFTCAQGWDPVTGWGSINVAALSNALQAQK